MLALLPYFSDPVDKGTESRASLIDLACPDAGVHIALSAQECRSHAHRHGSTRLVLVGGLGCLAVRGVGSERIPSAPGRGHHHAGLIRVSRASPPLSCGGITRTVGPAPCLPCFPPSSARRLSRWRRRDGWPPGSCERGGAVQGGGVLRRIVPVGQRHDRQGVLGHRRSHPHLSLGWLGVEPGAPGAAPHQHLIRSDLLSSTTASARSGRGLNRCRSQRHGRSERLECARRRSAVRLPFASASLTVNGRH